MIAYRPQAATLLLLLALFCASTGTVHGADKPRVAPPVKPATEYVVKDPHANEKVTVAAEPCTEASACPFFRLPYVSHGFIPVRVIVTNDRDQAINLEEVRIQFIPSEGEKLGAATYEDINRRLFSGKSAVGTKVPMLPITIHHEPVDKKIVNDDTDFGFQSTIVPPHSTRAGYVFYDTRSLDEPPLKHAELYVKMMHTVDDRGKTLELFGFTLPFDKWLAAQAPAASKPAASSEKKP